MCYSSVNTWKAKKWRKTFPLSANSVRIPLHYIMKRFPDPEDAKCVDFGGKVLVADEFWLCNCNNQEKKRLRKAKTFRLKWKGRYVS